MFKPNKPKKSYVEKKKRFPEIIIEAGADSYNSSPFVDRSIHFVRKGSSSPNVLKSSKMKLCPYRLDSTPSPERCVF
jgi:hypothetical protein